MLKQLKEIQIIQGIDQGGVRIVEPATLPDKAAWPKKSIILAIALFLGITIGAAAAVGPVLYKAPLMGIANAERHLGIPALGAIPKAGGKRGPHNIFLLDNPSSPGAEAIRSLRAMLLLHIRDAKSKVILFTSALAGEGKTFCALNSAAAFAVDGRRTLLIEADLRSPTIGFQLFGNKPVRGIVDVLSGQTEFEKTVLPSKVENLFVLTAGSPTDKPSEVLGSERMAEVLAKASVSYDIIIVDSAPILAASDALRIVTHAHLVCLVARCGATPGRAVARALQLLTSAEGSPPAGLVLNQAPGGVGS
jgi:capsular exopolysaccharide synthesis family protein